MICKSHFRANDDDGGAGEAASNEQSTYVIREIYESENSVESFLLQLERALQSRYKVIVIEPQRLAEETGRWIMLGNILSRTSILSGLVSITISVVSPNRLYVSIPLAGLSLVLQGFYDISWYFDPCSRYQVESTRSRNVTQYVDESVAKSATRILVYKDNTLINYAQRSIAAAAVLLCGFQLYRILK